MNKRKIIMLDIGVGNLLNVKRAFEFVGADVEIVSNAACLKDADRLVLPGVGAFPACAKRMVETGLDTAVIRHVEAERPLFGICVGMQLLFSYSEEFGKHEGLGLLNGHVAKIDNAGVDKPSVKVPHIGWSHLSKPSHVSSWENTFLAPFDTISPAFYFVHSFVATNVDEDTNLAEVKYGNHNLCVAVQKNNIIATQFHPERSGAAGLDLIRNYLAT